MDSYSDYLPLFGSAAVENFTRNSSSLFHQASSMKVEFTNIVRMIDRQYSQAANSIINEKIGFSKDNLKKYLSNESSDEFIKSLLNMEESESNSNMNKEKSVDSSKRQSFQEKYRTVFKKDIDSRIFLLSIFDQTI